MQDVVKPWYRRLHWQVLLARALGVATGLIGGPEAAAKIGWLGTLFIRLLKMIIVPLIFTSIVSGVASVGGGRDLGRLFSKTLGYYVLTSALAIFAGAFVAEIIRAGSRLGVDYSLTVSCYQADAEGRACGVCDSCRIRREGFKSAGLDDPTSYQ